MSQRNYADIEHPKSRITKILIVKSKVILMIQPSLVSTYHLILDQNFSSNFPLFEKFNDC